MNTVDAALDYLHRGWLPIPLCWPDAQARCACGHNPPHEGRDIAKAPLLGKGHQDVDPTEADIRRWWAHWPRANIGILLEPSGLLVVDCDNDEALQDALHRGLPPGPIVKTGKGCHYYYHANGAAGRTTKQGEHHALDVLARGYVVAPPSLHKEGRHYEWNLHPDDAEPQDAPVWAAAMLAKAEPQAAPPTADDGASPVRLDDMGADLWAGRAAVDKADGKLKPAAEVGETDRSETLYAIGCRLAKAGATSSTIIKALADRDTALGLDKYADRKDRGTAEYSRIAAKALAGVMSSNGHKKAQELAATTEQPLGVCGGSSNSQRVNCFIRADELASESGESGIGWLPVLGHGGFVGRGVFTLLSGRPKAGKTTFIAHAAKHWLTAGYRLAWLTEEPRGLWRQRLERIGLSNPNLLLAFPDPAASVDQWCDRLIGVQPDIVVVDTLRAFARIRDESDAGMVHRQIWPLVETARQLEAALIALHHRRKADGEEGTDHAGSHAFVGLADIAVSLKEDAASPRRRDLASRSRFEETPPKLLLELGEDGIYTVLGAPEVVGFKDAKSRAFDMLSEEWQATTAILESLTLPRPGRELLRQALHALVADGLVERQPGKGNRGDMWRLRQ